MHLDEYFQLTKGKKNKPCTITLKDGSTEEGTYLGETPGLEELGMVIRATGKSREKYENVGVSDPNPDFTSGDTLEIKENTISVRISAIESIEFAD
ncbi:MAG: hypothetical protein K2L21_10025 [Muribaculaceae bacterium]|nr:hypothetical protein [Muribaculaceae bacterium]